MAQQRRAVHNDSPKPMAVLNLLKSCSSFRSLDERDMLFADLNLALDTYGIRPNYAMSAYEMWITACKTLIQAEGNLVLDSQNMDFILGLSKGSISAPAEVPSWVLAAFKSHRIFTAISSEDRSNPLEWLSSSDENETIPPHMVNRINALEEDWNELLVEGVWLDTIQRESDQKCTFHHAIHRLLSKDRVFPFLDDESGDQWSFPSLSIPKSCFFVVDLLAYILPMWPLARGHTSYNDFQFELDFPRPRRKISVGIVDTT